MTKLAISVLMIAATTAAHAQAPEPGPLPVPAQEAPLAEAPPDTTPAPPPDTATPPPPIAAPDETAATAPEPAVAPEPDATPPSSAAQPLIEHPAVLVEELKSPTAALLLSLTTTVGGLALARMSSGRAEVLETAGVVMIAVGPTTGHVYAGNTWNTGLKLRLGGLGVALGGLLLVATSCPSGILDCTGDDAAAGLAVAVGGGLVYWGGAIYEIATAPRSARAYNRKHASRVQVGVAPLIGSQAGFAVAGRF